MLAVSRNIDKDFSDRLMMAAQQAGVPYKQTALGDFLGVNKQTVDVWMNGSVPRADTIFDIADKLRVDARWLATGAGEMIAAVPDSAIGPQLRDLISRYEAAGPRWKLSIRTLARIATEGDLNPDSVLTKEPLFRGRDGISPVGQIAKKSKRFTR